MEAMLPQTRFPVIDERRAPERRNVVGLMFRLWDLRDVEDLAGMIGPVQAWLGGSGERSLRDAFETVIEEQELLAYFEEGSKLRDARGLNDIARMLRGKVVPFAEHSAP